VYEKNEFLIKINYPRVGLVHFSLFFRSGCSSEQ
jgi:hypothetical protein